MKEPYGEGVASHTGPESCGGGSNAAAEALTGVRAGRVLSREMYKDQDADVVGRHGRRNRGHRQREMPQDPARSKALSMHGNILRGNREIPCLPEAKRVASGRIGKSKDSSQ
jgi:hypothetical protein